MIDRYQILEKLGEGGTGNVFKAWDKKLQRFVAVKSLLPLEERLAPGSGDDLASEAAALSALQHPNIVAIYDLDTDGPEPFVVMEHLNGETLESTVRRGRVLLADFLQLAAETLEGLVAAHRQGMCHRDLKPSNLMFHWLPDGRWQTKLLDFGLSNVGTRPARQELAGEGAVAGSVHFMAPEQFLHQPLDVRTDLYSLGCVLYYALTGSFPCGGATTEEVMRAHLARQVVPLHELRPDVPPLFTEWVMWLMSRQPEERPGNAAEALYVLRGIQTGDLSGIPAQEALKTRPLTPGLEVAAAPLNKDVAARVRAASAPVVPPGPPPGTSPHATEPVLPSLEGAPRPVTLPIPHPVPVTQAVPPPTAESRKSLNLPLLAGILAGVAAVAAGIYFFSRGPEDKPGSGNDSTQVPVEAPGGPPEKGLVMWFDAGKGARKDAGQKEAVPGDRVDQWNDRAPLAGNNAAQYHTTSSSAAEKILRRPTLERVTDEDGLKGTHDILRFRGENCLVCARDGDKVGDPVGGALSGARASWIGVFSAEPAEGDQTLLSAHVGQEFRAWDTFVRGGLVFSGARKAGGAENHASLPWEPAGSFHIVAVMWDGPSDRLRQWVTGPDGKTAAGPVVTGTVDFGNVADIRIGALNHSSGRPGDFLKGGIASLLIYNYALDDAEREAAVDYLSRRYFGVPATRP